MIFINMGAAFVQYAVQATAYQKIMGWKKQPCD